MEIKFLKRSILQRIMGISATRSSKKVDTWKYSDGRIIIDLDKYPELMRAGGAVSFEGRNLPGRVLVVCWSSDDYSAFENRCTHGGHRRLDPVVEMKAVQCCSIGKATFNLCGEKLYGPAPKSITSYTTIKDSNQLIVSLEG